MTAPASERLTVSAYEAAMDVRLYSDPAAPQQASSALLLAYASTVVQQDERIAAAAAQHEPADYDPRHCVTCLESMPCTTRKLLLGVQA